MCWCGRVGCEGPHTHTPNEATRAAMAELDAGGGTSHTSIDEMIVKAVEEKLSVLPQYEIVPLDIPVSSAWWKLERSISLSALHVPQAVNIRKEMSHPDATYFIAMYGPRVIGFEGIKETGIHHTVWEIPWCIVDPEFRGKGIGKALTNTCIDYAVGHGGKAVFLSTPAPRLYEWRGFKVVGELPGDVWAKHLMLLVLNGV